MYAFKKHKMIEGKRYGPTGNGWYYQPADYHRKVSIITKIKLDHNFGINILGGEENIERSYDEERGMKYYTLCFERER